jgi:uncharacterized protein (TIGR01244 family)
MLDIRVISDRYAVAPQIEPNDIPALKEAGYRTVICNRPDAEVPAELSAEVLRIATEAAGLRFIENPVDNGGMSMDHVSRQAAALAGSEGKTMAYCASGTRSAVVWAFSSAGEIPTDDILGALTKAGYPMDGLRAQLDSLAAG